MNNFNTPAEISAAWINTGVAKSKLSVHKMLILGVLAGIYIGFGATAYITVFSGVGGGLGKFLGAALFPVGLMMVIICGAELFTGNNLLVLALLDKKITLAAMLKNWIFVYIGNLAGSVILALVVAECGLFSADAIKATTTSIAVAKTSAPFMQMLLRGILCNMVVVLACWLQAGGRDLISKIFGIFFPIMLFVVCGFEHSIANMYYIPLGIFLGADVSFAALWTANLIPVTLGNIIGGALVVPGMYYFTYVKQSKQS